MIVDDDARDLFNNAMLLQRFEYNICTTRTVEEALEMAAVAVPVLIVADTKLPGSGIFGLLRNIRQDPRTAKIPVLVLAPGNDPEARKRYADAGAAGCISKPVSAEDLYRAVQAAVEDTPRGNIRIRARVPIIVNGDLLDCGGGDCVSLLSEHGMYISTLQPLPADARVSIQFTLSGRTLAVSAVVLYSYRRGEGPYREPGMGLKFTLIRPDDQAFLREHIHAEITRGLVRREK